MKVKFSPSTKNDFTKYVEYLKELKKKDSKQYSHIKPEQSKVKFRGELKQSISDKKEHKDSIFPKEFEYNSKTHKMYVDKKTHHVVFYKITTPKKGEPYISVEKCIHSTELKQELEDRDIKPLKGADKTLLSDLEQVYREDDVKNKEEYEDEETIEKEDTDDEGNPRQHKTGPNGGKYYRVKKDGKWGPWNSLTNENNNIFKSLKLIINESKIRSLKSYLKK